MGRVVELCWFSENMIQNTKNTKILIKSMDQKEIEQKKFNQYKKITTLIVFFLAVILITLGILINTNKAVHDFFFREFFVPAGRSGILAYILWLFKPSLVSKDQLEKTSLFYIVPLLILVLIFLIGKRYFDKKKRYELADGKKKGSKKKFKTAFIALSIISFVSLVNCIIETAKLVTGYNGELQLVISLMLFLSSLLLIFVWN